LWIRIQPAVHYLRSHFQAEADSWPSAPLEDYDECVASKDAANALAWRVYTIGHSTRPIEEFIALLTANGLERLLDIRTIPKSRHNPQFHTDSLSRYLRAKGIDYVHLKELGGLRRPRPDSPNTGWRNASFRGYADYMQTEEFDTALRHAIELARQKPTALMCAEALPWRCHRSLVADALVVRGIEVLEIVSSSLPKPHALTPFARVRGTHITYPAEASADPCAPAHQSSSERKRGSRR
jgi:Protein of unknown function, DUF488